MTQAWRNTRLLQVLKTFGAEVLRRSSVGMELEAFLGRIGASGKCCLEIGTYNGVSTLVLAQFFERVVTISLDDPETDLSHKHRIWKLVGAHNIQGLDIKDDSEKRALVDDLDFQFAYLDGDHVNCTASDFALTQRCGKLLFHEYWPLQPPVWNLVNALPRQEVMFAQYDCLAYWERGASFPVRAEAPPSIEPETQPDASDRPMA